MAPSPRQGVHCNLFELTPYKGLRIVVCLLNGHLYKDLALKNSYFVYLQSNVTILL